MKKFFYLCFSVIFCCFCAFSLTGCKKNEIKKVSKNLNTYAISAELDTDKMEISGSEKVTYKNDTSVELEEVCFHLYPRAFREGALVKPYTALNEASCFPNGISYGDLQILKVTVNGDIKKHSLSGEDEDILKISLGFKLKPNKTIEIVIDFVVTIPNSTHRFGYYDNNINLGNWYPVLCEFESGAFDTSPYYSTGDPFFSELANYEVDFIYPCSYVLTSTGEGIVTQNGQKNEIKISAKAVRDFALVLSKNAKTETGKVGNTTVTYLGYKSDSNTKQMLELSKEALAFFGKSFGEYPYSTLVVAKTPFLFGGMEYPNLVMISDSVSDEEEFMKVIVHEIAHQWWYGVVGNNEIKEAWLDESLSEYSTALFFEANPKYNISYKEFVESAVSSYLLYVDVISTIRGDVNTKMNLAVNEYQNEYEYSYMVYVKGVIMFDSLKQAVGEKKVIAGLKKYYQNNKFKTATKNDFFASFKSACHSDIETFFESYLNGTAVITNLN